MMPYQEFRRKVREAGPWKRLPVWVWGGKRVIGDAVRTSRERQCPLAAVMGESDWVQTVPPAEAAERLGIPLLAAERIADAADDALSPWRPLLLKMLGM